MATLTELLFASAERAVTFFVRAGKTIAETFANLLKRFPGTTQRVLNAVYARTQQSMTVSEQLNTAFPGYKAPRSAYPRNPTIQQAYRYGVTITYHDPAKGEDVFRYLEINSPGNLSNEEVRALAIDQAAQTFFAGGSGQLPAGTEPQPVGIEIILSEKRT